MKGKYLAQAPQLDGVASVTIRRERRCTAVVVTARLAISIASCFLSLPLNDSAQEACLRGGCVGSIVAPETVRLVGASDARVGFVVARVKRISVRFTAPWAIPACTRALCGEGWDIALLDLDPTCDHGPLPCMPPLRVATRPATIGLLPLAVGFGGNPSYDRVRRWESHQHRS